MKRIVQILAILIAAVTAVAAPSASSPSKGALLPKIFAGWQMQSSSTSADAAKVDPVNADVLKEDGVNAIETAEYTKPDRKLTVKVARFGDASGAYSAFLFYRTPQMAPVDVGDQGASSNDRILFRDGNLLVDAKFDRMTPMTAGELRELANDLPQLIGNAAKPPDITRYLPKQGMVESSVKYVTGPVGLARIGSRLPADAVEFGANPEIATAQYNTGEGTAELTLISYPTPALAGNGLRKVQAWHPAAAQGSPAPTLFSKRTGPYVVVLTGTISDGEAKTLLASVNYDPDVTWNENTHFDRNSNLGSLLVNIIILLAVIAVLAIVAGVAFGGVRIVLKRLFPDRVFDRSQDVEIIRLNIGK
jgi:hypothetical protein